MKKAILFVHGLNGGENTWSAFKELIHTDDGLNYTPFFYEYPSARMRVLPFLQKKYGNIQSLSKGLKTYIDHRLDEYDEISLVGHSLGGLIVRQYLLDQRISRRPCKVKKIIFYAVPQEGSELARIGSLVSFGHRHLNQLCKIDTVWGRTKLTN